MYLPTSLCTSIPPYVPPYLPINLPSTTFKRSISIYGSNWIEVSSKYARNAACAISRKQSALSKWIFFPAILRLRIKSHLPHRRARKTQRDNSPKDSSPKDNYNNSNPAASSASETRTLFLFYFVIKLQMKCQIKTSAVDLNVVLSRDSNPGPQDGRAQIHWTMVSIFI